MAKDDEKTSTTSTSSSAGTSSGSSSSSGTSSSGSKTTKADGASATREVAQSQTDQVAIVSRTATGEAHQHPGYEIVGLPDDATAEQKAAAENRPSKKKS